MYPGPAFLVTSSPDAVVVDEVTVLRLVDDAFAVLDGGLSVPLRCLAPTRAEALARHLAWCEAERDRVARVLARWDARIAAVRGAM